MLEPPNTLFFVLFFIKKKIILVKPSGEWNFKKYNKNYMVKSREYLFFSVFRNVVTLDQIEQNDNSQQKLRWKVGSTEYMTFFFFFYVKPNWGNSQWRLRWFFFLIFLMWNQIEGTTTCNDN